MEVVSNQRYISRRFDSYCFIENEFYDGIKFEDCSFDDINISGVTFNECEFIECSFENTTLCDTVLNDSHLNKCVFDKGNILGCSFDLCCLDNCEVTNMVAVYDMEIKGGAVRRCLFYFNTNNSDTLTFEDVLLMSCKFDSFTFNACGFVGCNVRGVEFVDTDFTNGDIENTVFAWCKFFDCEFARLLIQDTDFILCKFYQGKFKQDVKIRKNVNFIDSKARKTEIPAVVHNKINVQCYINNDDKARPPAAPSTPTTSAVSSLAGNFIHSMYGNRLPRCNPYAEVGFKVKRDETQSRFCFPEPKQRSKKAVRFFTSGV